MVLFVSLDVDHHILFKKSYAYGSRGKVLEWLHRYLFNRTQCVIYNDMQSETRHVICGVPQGSIMGSLLFFIYMNDICNASKFVYIIRSCTLMIPVSNWMETILTILFNQ